MNIFLRLSTLPVLLFVATGTFASTGLFNAQPRTTGQDLDTDGEVLLILTSAEKSLRVGTASEFVLEVMNNKYYRMQGCEPVLEQPDGFDLSWSFHRYDGSQPVDTPFDMGSKGFTRQVVMEVTPTAFPKSENAVELAFNLNCESTRQGARGATMIPGPKFSTAFSRASVTIEPEYLLTLGSGDEDARFIDLDPESGEGFLDWSLSLHADSQYDYIRLYMSGDVPAGFRKRACSHRTGCKFDVGKNGVGARIDRGTDATGWLAVSWKNAGTPNLDDVNNYQTRVSVHGYAGGKKIPIKGWNLELRTMEKPLYCASISFQPDGHSSGWTFFVEEPEDLPYIRGAYATDFLMDIRREADTDGAIKKMGPQARQDSRAAVMRYIDAITHRGSGTSVAESSGGRFEIRVHPSASRFQVYIASLAGLPISFWAAEGNLKDEEGAWHNTLTQSITFLDPKIPLDTPAPEGYHSSSSYVGPSSNFFNRDREETLTWTRSTSGSCP